MVEFLPKIKGFRPISDRRRPKTNTFFLVTVTNSFAMCQVYTENSKNMSHRRKLVIAVGIVMLLFTGIWVATMHIAPENDVEKYKKELIAKGEKLEISEVLPPPVPPEQNGADVVNEAAKLIVGIPENPNEENTNLPLSMCIIAPGRAIVCFEQPDVRTEYFTNSWSNVLSVVEANRPATEMLNRVMGYPALDFRLDYTNGLDVDTSYLDVIDRCTQLLSAAAICDLHEGETASAATNICALLALVNGEQFERTIASQGRRTEFSSLAMGANWELLQSSNVNDADLAMLQKSWERLEFFHATENAFLMNRAAWDREIQKARDSNEELTGLPVRVTPIYAPPPYPGAPSPPGTWSDDLSSLWYTTKLAYSKTMWRTSWSYSDELHTLRDDQVMLETIRTIETNGFFYPTYTNLENQFYGKSASTPNDWFAKLGILDLHNFFSERSLADWQLIDWIARSEGTKRMAIVAIALKRYQLKYGKYPSNLDSLAPEFVHAVPPDPIDGKPLRYRQNEDGTFLLYSIGLNGSDDGGAASPEDWLSPEALDWVWPQPATAAEIEYFYAHPPL